MPYWADRATAALARELNSLRKDSAVLILLARSVLEDLVIRHINTTLYVILSRIIPTPLIPNYMEKLEVIFCVRGVISPLLSNINLNEVDEMLERAKEVTRNGRYTYLEYVRYADDGAPRRRGKECNRQLLKLQPCCTEDEGGPLGAAMQVEASNHLKLLWSKATVVSVKEKVPRDGIR
jgi:hypothetical protein